MSHSQRFDADETDLRPDPLRRDATAVRPCPTVAWRDAAGSHTRVLEGRALLGSAADADIVVADPSASRLHAELEPGPDGVWVRDLGSRNGTFIEGVRVLAGRVPEAGRVRVGGTDVVVRYAAAQTAVALWPLDRFGPLLGPSAVMRELFARLARVAATALPVLIQGETGTGRELAARAVHEHSPRAAGPFVVVDCGALPEHLLDAELFGHARGAFTGAAASRAGAIETAEGGTVFLDEIGELPLAMQPKLLRAIESRTVRRLGEAEHRGVDVRFVAATHRDLRQMVNAGAFREDLYFRLAVLPVTIPPLRARPEDIPALVRHFAPGAEAGPLDPDFARELATRSWLGNVRELRNLVERARVLGADHALAMAVPDEPARARADAGDALPPVPLDRPFKELREQWLDHLEREYVRGMLARYKGNVTLAAEAAGLDRTYLHRLVRKHEL